MARSSILTDNGNGIVYVVLLHYWTQVFGNSDFSLRFPSAIAGMVVVALSAGLSTKLFGAAVGAVCGLFAATNPLLVRYSQEGRGYAFATAFVLAAGWLLVSLPMGPRARIRALLYGTCAGLAVLCHYLAAGVLAAQWAWFVLVNRSRRTVALALVGGLWSVVIVGVWLFGLGGAAGLEGTSRRNAAYAKRAADPSGSENFALPATSVNVTRGLVQTVAPMFGNMLQGLDWRLQRLSLLLVIPATLLWGWRVRATDSGAAGAFVWWSALASPLFATFLALRSGHVISFQPLYSTFSTPFAMMLLAVGAVRLARIHGPVTYAPLAVQAAIVLLSLLRVWVDAPWYRPPNAYPDLARELKSRAAVGYALEFPSHEVASRVALYWEGEFPRYLVRRAGSVIRLLPPDRGTAICLPVPPDAPPPRRERQEGEEGTPALAVAP